MRMLLPHPDLRDVALRPAATARVWLGVGMPLETVAVPGIGLDAGDVLVAIELSTICESDLRVVAGERSVTTPLVLGHESVGRVIAIGADGASTVDGGELRVGDRIVWSTTVTCGTCDRCSAGLPQRCRNSAAYGFERIEPRWELTGGYATHAHLRRGTAIVRVPETLPAASLAPASCATATAFAAVLRAGRDLDGVAVKVYGAGPIGLAAAAIATERGARVSVADASPERRRRAERFGAVTAGTDAPRVVIETSGVAVAEAIRTVDDGGRVVIADAAPSAGATVVDAEEIARRHLTILGVDASTGAELAGVVEFLTGRGRAYPFADLVGSVRPLDEADAALAAASAAGAPLRIGLAPL